MPLTLIRPPTPTQTALRQVGALLTMGLAVRQVWVVNYTGSTVSRFNLNGSTAGAALSGNGLGGPTGIALVNGVVWVVNYTASTVSRFNIDGSIAGAALSGNGLSSPEHLIAF